MNGENEIEGAAPDDEYIIVRNAEQQGMIDALVQLRQVCNGSIDMIEAEFPDNESLYGQPVHWDEFTCVKAERFLDSEGGLGWRVYCSGIGTNATKLQQCLRDKLTNAGYEDVEVTPVC